MIEVREMLGDPGRRPSLDVVFRPRAHSGLLVLPIFASRPGDQDELRLDQVRGSCAAFGQNGACERKPSP